MQGVPKTCSMSEAKPSGTLLRSTCALHGGRWLLRNFEDHVLCGVCQTRGSYTKNRSGQPLPSWTGPRLSSTPQWRFSLRYTGAVTASIDGLIDRKQFWQSAYGASGCLVWPCIRYHRDWLINMRISDLFYSQVGYPSDKPLS